LETFNKEQTSRLHYLKEFFSSVSKIEKTINIIEKKYLFGNEEKIFENAKELLDQKNLQLFHIDGLIFAPATLPYPTKIGSWSALFKWKPPNLNSIDFLIKTVKNKTFMPCRDGQFDFYFDKEGLVVDNEKSVIEYAMRYGIIVRAGAWYNYGDKKWQGGDAVIAEMKGDKKLYEEIQGKVTEIVNA